MLVGRLDVVESVGAVIERVAVGPVGVRRAAEGVAVPYTTAWGWWRRFASSAQRLAVAFAASAVELAGRHQHGFAPVDRRQTSFHASGRLIGGFERRNWHGS